MCKWFSPYIYSCTSMCMYLAICGSLALFVTFLVILIETHFSVSLKTQFHASRFFWDLKILNRIKINLSFILFYFCLSLVYAWSIDHPISLTPLVNGKLRWAYETTRISIGHESVRQVCCHTHKHLMCKCSVILT